MLPGVTDLSTNEARDAAERSSTTASRMRPEPRPRTSTAPTTMDLALSRQRPPRRRSSMPPTRPHRAPRRRDTVPFRAQHGAAKLLQHRPRRLVAGEAELSLELDRRKPRRVGRDQIARREPEPERNSRAVQNRARCHRSLVSARPALQEIARGNFMSILATAARAAKTVRPPARHEIASAVLVRPEPFLELGQRTREIGSSHGADVLSGNEHNM